MLFAPDRCVFKITVFSCVVVSVFSDGRMGFYRGGWRCCVAGCVAASGCPVFGGRVGAVWFVVLFCLPVCFAVRPGGFFFSVGGGVGGGCCLRHTAGGGLRFWCGNAGMLWVCALAVMCRCGAGFG